MSQARMISDMAKRRTAHRGPTYVIRCRPARKATSSQGVLPDEALLQVRTERLRNRRREGELAELAGVLKRLTDEHLDVGLVEAADGGDVLVPGLHQLDQPLAQAGLHLADELVGGRLDDKRPVVPAQVNLVSGRHPCRDLQDRKS